MPIPKDKQYHFIAGLFIYLISQLFLPIGFDLIPVAIIGASKEIYDYITKKGNLEVMDFIYTMLGAMPVFLIKLLLHKI